MNFFRFLFLCLHETFQDINVILRYFYLLLLFMYSSSEVANCFFSDLFPTPFDPMIATLNICLGQILSREAVAPVEHVSASSLAPILYVLRRLNLSPQFFSPPPMRLKDRTLSKSGVWTMALMTEGLGKLFLLCERIASEDGLSIRREEDRSTGCNFFVRFTLHCKFCSCSMFENIALVGEIQKLQIALLTSLAVIYTHPPKRWLTTYYQHRHTSAKIRKGDDISQKKTRCGQNINCQSGYTITLK